MHMPFTIQLIESLVRASLCRMSQAELPIDMALKLV
jgi:hypothetical protein